MERSERRRYIWELVSVVKIVGGGGGDSNFDIV